MLAEPQISIKERFGKRRLEHLGGRDGDDTGLAPTFRRPRH